MPDNLLEHLAEALARAPCVAALALGGSRARGTATPSSDFDIGLYYRRGAEPDVDRLRKIVTPLVDGPAGATVTEIGEWGPWIVGGAWLSVGGRKVDILYRCLESVEEVIRACAKGEVTMHYKPGHPHGFSSAIWMGEAALCRLVHDPDGALAALKAMTVPYLERLGRALVDRFLWEVAFSIENGELAVARGDVTHVAGCAHWALACAGQVLFALNRRYLINEKGALKEAARFPVTIPNLEEKAAPVWRGIGRGALQESLDALRVLDGDLEAIATGKGSVGIVRASHKTLESRRSMGYKALRVVPRLATQPSPMDERISRRFSDRPKTLVRSEFFTKEAPERMQHSLLSSSVVGSANRGLVIQALYDLGPTSRAELARRAGVNRTTISGIVQPLIDDHVLVETEPDQVKSKGGKPGSAALVLPQRPPDLRGSAHAGRGPSVPRDARRRDHRRKSNCPAGGGRTRGPNHQSRQEIDTLGS